MGRGRPPKSEGSDRAIPVSSQYKQRVKPVSSSEMASALSIKRRMDIFAAEYIKTRDPALSAIAAGFNQAGASSAGKAMLKNFHVVSTIRRETVKIIDASRLKAEYIVKNLMAIVEGDSSDTNRLKALELLGRHLGMFTDNVNVTHDTGNMIVPIFPVGWKRRGQKVIDAEEIDKEIEKKEALSDNRDKKAAENGIQPVRDTS